MSNPYSRPQAGSYKPLLVQGLKNIGRTTEANEFENDSMKLAIVSSITGNAKTFPQLSKILVDALNTLGQSETVRYYRFGLENADFVPASTNGAYVYDLEDKKAVAYVEKRLAEENGEILNPYFTKD